jgi:hypothetical protein
LRRDPGVFESLLLSDGAVPVDPASSKEAVMLHALENQKKDE